MSSDDDTAFDLKELEAHTLEQLEEGKSRDSLFEFIAYLNVNETGTHILSAEKVMSDPEIAELGTRLMALDIDVSAIGAPVAPLTGGDAVARAIGALFVELTELCDLPDDHVQAGDISEETLLLLNLIKHYNPGLRRLTVALTETGDDDVACEYEAEMWDAAGDGARG